MLFVLVIAVASGLACLSCLLIAAFCLLRQRKKDTRDLEDELGPLEDRLSPVKRIRSNPKIRMHHSRKESDIGTNWPTIPPIVYEPTNLKDLDAMNPLDVSLEPPFLFSRSKAVVPESVGVFVSSQTGRSETTVSIYSTESAPPQFHDQFSNPFFLRRAVARANLPKGMDLPSTIARNTGLFTRPLPQSGTANIQTNSDDIHLDGRASPEIPRSYFDPGTVKSSYSLTTPIPHSAYFAALEPKRSQLLYRGVNLQALKKIAPSSFPPPSW
jgi:hypothetical protein